MAVECFDTATSKSVAIGGSSLPLGITMVAGEVWCFTNSANCWIKQGTTPTAVASAAANMYVPANSQIDLDGACGPNLAVIQDGASTGSCSLTRLRRL